jgi:hypothetical protein
MTLQYTNKIAYYDLLSDKYGYSDVSQAPLSAGMMENIVYILHNQPLGTITFFNLETFEKTEIRGVNVNGLLDR